MQRSNIVLIGMPGAGKSTLGPLIAAKYHMQTIDVDLTMAKTKRDLQRIVNGYSFDEFVAFEEKALLSISAKNAVIITGGSAIFCENAMAYHKEQGVFLYLRLPLAMLHKRTNFLHGGILKKSHQTLEDVYYERLPFYEKYADITVDAYGADIKSNLYAITQTLDKVFQNS